jgi:hypothetical protein
MPSFDGSHDTRGAAPLPNSVMQKPYHPDQIVVAVKR